MTLTDFEFKAEDFSSFHIDFGARVLDLNPLECELIRECFNRILREKLKNAERIVDAIDGRSVLVCIEEKD